MLKKRRENCILKYKNNIFKIACSTERGRERDITRFFQFVTEFYCVLESLVLIFGDFRYLSSKAGLCTICVVNGRIKPQYGMHCTHCRLRVAG